MAEEDEKEPAQIHATISMAVSPWRKDLDEAVHHGYEDELGIMGCTGDKRRLAMGNRVLLNYELES